MKKKMSICFFMGAALGCLLPVFFILLYQTGNQTKPEEISEEREDRHQAEEFYESMASGAPAFYLDVEDGYVIVLKSDHQTVYSETNIRYHSLPDIVQMQIIEGISFSSEAELFDFLESYSS